METVEPSESHENGFLWGGQRCFFDRAWAQLPYQCGVVRREGESCQLLFSRRSSRLPDRRRHRQIKDERPVGLPSAALQRCNEQQENAQLLCLSLSPTALPLIERE